MRRVAFAVILLAFVLSVIPASAVPGPDPPDANDWFGLRFLNSNFSPKATIEREDFQEADGWDFGDRAAYQCAFTEFFQAGSELFEVHFELVGGITWAQIVDKHGVQTADGTAGAICGNGTTAPETFDGSDHFPHGTMMEFFLNGQPLSTLDLHPADVCAKGYWTPGDESGEAWLWWDDDGPTNDGHGDLNCPGNGAGEPVPVLRATVRNMGAGVSVCSEDTMDGDLCSIQTLTLQSGDTRLLCPDGAVPVILNPSPLIVRCQVGLWTPPRSLTLYESNLGAPSSTPGTVITAGTPAHTKNATYTELIASTAFDAYWIDVILGDVDAASTDTRFLVDIAIGAVSSETVIIPNLNAGGAAPLGASTNSGGQRYTFPLYIPAGSRLSATGQAVTAADTCRVLVYLHGGGRYPDWVGQQVVAYGANTGTSQGVAVTSGLSAAEGNWTQITASTSQNHYFLSIGPGLDGDQTAQTAQQQLDVGVGAAPETAIYEGFVFGTGATEALSVHMAARIWQSIPAGARLSARISRDVGTAADFDVILYGVS